MEGIFFNFNENLRSFLGNSGAEGMLGSLKGTFVASARDMRVGVD